MSVYRVIEVFDGRLPEYQVVKTTHSHIQTVLKTFDTYEAAEKFCKEQLEDGITSCGEEDPCYFQD